MTHQQYDLRQEYLRAFLFGVKFISLVFALALPIVMWLFFIGSVLPKTVALPVFQRSALGVISLWADQMTAIQRARERGQAVYRYTLPFSMKTSSGKEYEVLLPLEEITRSSQAAASERTSYYVVTTRRVRDQYERDKVREALDGREVLSYLNGAAMPVSWTEIVPPTTTRFADTVGFLLGLAFSILCLATYFPLGRAIISLFKRRSRN